MGAVLGSKKVKAISFGGTRRAEIADPEGLGLEDIAVHVKGMAPGGFDPRVLRGMGLSYATSARGACHLRGTFYKAELSGMIEKERIEGKAELMIDFEDRAALFDSLILCRFYRNFIQWDELRSVIRATTGLDLTKEELTLMANEMTLRTRRFNRREGIDERFDTLPPLFLRERTKPKLRKGSGQLSIYLKGLLSIFPGILAYYEQEPILLPGSVEAVSSCAGEE